MDKATQAKELESTLDKQYVDYTNAFEHCYNKRHNAIYELWTAMEGTRDDDSAVAIVRQFWTTTDAAYDEYIAALQAKLEKAQAD